MVPGLLIFKPVWSHSDTPHSVELFLDDWPTRRRHLLYLTTHSTHKTETSTSPKEFEPTTPASERPQNQALERTATGIGVKMFAAYKFCIIVNLSVCMFNFALHYLFNIQHPLHAHLMKPSKFHLRKWERRLIWPFTQGLDRKPVKFSACCIKSCAVGKMF